MKRKNPCSRNNQQSDRRRVFEVLEPRTLLSSAVDSSNIFIRPNLTLAPQATSASVNGYSPAQIASAYGFDKIALANGVQGDGSGQTIAIVDAFNDPNIASDLGTFDKTFGLADTNLQVV